MWERHFNFKMRSSKYEVAFITEVKFSPRNFLPSPLITHTNNKNQGSMRKTNKIPQKRVADKLVIKLECNTLPRDGMEIFFFLLLLFRRGCTNMFAFEKNENPLTLNFEPFFFRLSEERHTRSWAAGSTPDHQNYLLSLYIKNGVHLCVNKGRTG